MAQKYKAPGEVLDVVAPVGGLTTDVPVKIGSIIGVALNTAAVGVTGQVAINGVFRDMPKATGQAWAQGDMLYWSAANSNFTTTATANTFAGYAETAAASGDSVGCVLLSH